MATAVLPFRMASQQPFSAKSTLAPPSASSSRAPESLSSSPTANGLAQSSGNSFGKIRSQLEQTLRSATRSKTKLPSLPTEDFATVNLKTHKGKERAPSSDEVPKEHQEEGRSGVLKRWELKIGFRTSRESITLAQSPTPQTVIGKTKDGGTKNMKIQERERVRSGGLTSFVTPSLRQATMSSPALHLSSQAIPSPKSQSAVPASSSSTASILVSPPIDRADKTRRSSLQQFPTEEISEPIPLSAKREAQINGITNGNGQVNLESRTLRRPPPLNLPSSPSILTPSHSQPRTPSERSHERPRTPESPTPQPSRSRHKKAAASLGNIPLNSTAPVTLTPRTGSPTTRAKSPSTRTRIASPSQRGVMSASTSHLPLSPSPTTGSSFEAQRRPHIDTRICIDGPRRASIDAPGRPSLDTPRRPSDSSRTPPGVSPSTPVRARSTTPNQRANSPTYTQNWDFNVSSSSLAPTCTPEQRELIRSATSILCREMRKPPHHLSGSQAGLREWQGVEHRLQHLVGSERIWGKSGSILSGTSSQLSVPGSSAGGEERERRLFCEALRDGFVLCQLMNKLKPNTIARVDLREDGFIRTSNVTKFLASCSSQGVPSEDLFYRDDLIESTPDSLVRVARTIISVVKVVEFPAVDRSKVLTGQNKGPSDNWSGPYGYGTNSRAASSVPNLSQCSASPTTPNSRKRRSPPSPNLPTVRSVSPSERGSGGSSRTNKTASNQNGRTTPVADRPQAIASPVLAGTRPALMPRSPLWAQRKSKTASDIFTQLESFTIPISQIKSTLAATPESSLQRSVAESVARQSSTATDISAYSSLMDVRKSNNRYGTIRTVTTEATSFAPSDMPSYTRTEASSIAASMSEEMTRKRVMGRERKPSEAAVVDLSRVTEERPEDIASQPGSKAGPPADKGKRKEVIDDGKDDTPSPERVHLGKGKWPDDFLDVFQGRCRTQPIPIKSTDRDTSPGRNSPISVSPPRKLAIVGASGLNERHDSMPRRPTHRARHSVENTSLAPKESVFRRETSPDGSPSSGPRVVLRRTSTTKRNGTYIPRNSPRASTEFKNGGEPLVPFPRTVSGENASSSPAPSSNGHPGSDDDKPRLQRGRFHSDIEGASSRRRARPSSYDELGNRPRRTRFESMVNLGIGSSNASASDIISRDLVDGSAFRQTLIVREDGKPPTHFQLGNCIGRGQFGSVYRALNLSTGQMVAVKRIRLEGLKEDEVIQLMREVVLVRSLSHPSIVKYEGMARDEDTLNIVLEYVENGSLGQTLKAFGKLNERLVASYVVKILEGLHYLHQSDVVHCDLKAANILTTKNGNVKLSDFGVSLNLRAMEREMKDVAGTPNWMAPEVIELKGASTKADIWSLGCTVIELLTGRPPYAEIANSMSVMFRIVEDNMPPLPEEASPLLQDFLKVCFNKDPTLRPSAELLCEHEWLKKSWSGLKDLRPQDSIPFLRRVSTDFQKSEALHLLSHIDTSAANSPFEDDLPRPEIAITGTPPSPISARRISHDHALPDDMSPRDHSFVKTTFSKPMVCRVCLLNVKKSAVICESCSLIGHSKCAANAPPTCDLRVQLLLYAQFADKGNPGSAYSNSVDLLKVGGGHIPTSPMSEVAYMAPSQSSQMSIGIPIVQSPPHGSPNRPAAFKFMAAFKTKRSKTSLARELAVQGSSTSLLPAASDIHSQGDIYEHLHDRRGKEKALSKKPSVLLKRKPGYKQRPQSLSNNSASPNMTSMCSAANSLSSRLEVGKKSAVTDTGTRNRPSAGESEVPRPSHLASISAVSTISSEHNDDHPNMIPGSMPPDNPRHKTDSKSGNCAVQ